ncbi:Hypothetical predicted protein [Paramuricea clavata]|uniref:DUF1758 domain-containing protein n=1 Tax=Paramuricea clavata TaxID=317549 RepID=A0A6S7JEK9_PARCT|nr:Hypothetical predicted protein [Paramuricea clavata]
MLPINVSPLNYSSPFGTQVTTNITEANTPLPTLPGTSTGFCLNTSAQTFIPSSTFHSESSSTSGQTHLSQQCQNPTNLSTGFPAFAMPMGSNLPRVASSYYSNHNQTRSNLSTSPMYTTLSGHQPTVPLINTRPSHQDSTIRLKRMALPTFSGLRKDWPEFKAVWKSMAESASYNKTALAHELKNSVKGEAKHRIKSVFVTKPEAYDIMWEKLECHYGDTTASVQAALEDLQRLKPVKEEDYKALVELVDEVESAYSQLEELNQLNTLTMRAVDNLTDLLPTHLKVDWRRKYRDLSSAEKLQQFTPLMKFLERERSVVARLAENQHSKKRGNDNARGYNKTYHVERGAKHGQRTYYKCAFPTHRKDTINHTTEQCKEFQKLSISGKDGRYELLKQLPKDSEEKSKTGDDGNKEVASYTVGSDSMALYPIHQATISDSGKKVSVFCDGGSNASYITHRAAERIKARKVKKLSLDVTTMGNVEKTYNTWQYEFPINTSAGKKVTITAFGIERITGQVSKLDPEVLVKLFPEYDPETLQRKSTHVDVLLGCDYFGLHPKQEEARCGDNLSIMNGALGICLQGAHPDLIEETRYDTNLAKKIHDVNVKVETYKTRLDSHPEFHPNHTRECSVNVSSSYSHRKDESQIDNFIQGEELTTESSPQCGGCRCNKCPTVGHTYSFKEEQELKLIQENLEYDEVNQCWITSYP